MSTSRGLTLIDDLVAEGRSHVASREVAERLGLSPQAASNLLRRLVDQGLLDRVGAGRYVVRPLGVLGTPVAAESLPVAVGAALAGLRHRIAYRSALDEHELLAHPAREIQVAAAKRVRRRRLSDRPLRVVVEPEHAIGVGATPVRSSWMSDPERALLDAAARPTLVGGAVVIAEALVAAAGANPERLTSYARQLDWGAALRRIGSLADRLEIAGLAGRLAPLQRPTADLDLEPSSRSGMRWRDAAWRIRWHVTPDELAEAVR